MKLIYTKFNISGLLYESIVCLDVIDELEKKFNYNRTLMEIRLLKNDIKYCHSIDFLKKIF